MRHRRLCTAPVLLHMLLACSLAHSRGVHAHPFSNLLNSVWGHHQTSSSSSSHGAAAPHSAVDHHSSAAAAAAFAAAAHAVSSSHTHPASAHPAQHGRQLLQSSVSTANTSSLHMPAAAQPAAAATAAGRAASSLHSKASAAHPAAAAKAVPQHAAAKLAGKQQQQQHRVSAATAAAHKPAAAKAAPGAAAPKSGIKQHPVQPAANRTATATKAGPHAAAQKAGKQQQHAASAPAHQAASTKTASHATVAKSGGKQQQQQQKPKQAQQHATAAKNAAPQKASTQQQHQQHTRSPPKPDHRLLLQASTAQVHITQAEPEFLDSIDSTPTTASPAAAAAAAVSTAAANVSASAAAAGNASAVGVAGVEPLNHHSPYGSFHMQQPAVEKPAWCSKAEGKVSQVSCWLNEKGLITGIQLTEDAGKHQPGICMTSGPPSVEAYLEEHEAIVEIRACKEHTLASTYGYSYMEFWTDGGRTRPVTCGHMPQTMKCEVISSGKVPSWHSSEHTQKGHKWYKEPIYSYDDYKINGRAYAKTAAYEIDDADSSAVSIASVAPQGAYYSHVFPLSELKGTCNTYGLLGRLDSACWNKAYKPKPKEVELGVKLTMDDYYTCPKHSDDILPLVCYVRDSLQELLYKHGIEGKIKVAPVECKADMFMNTTISFVGQVRAKHWHKHKGSFSHKVLSCLSSGSSSSELCDTYADCLACEDHGVFSWEVEKLHKLPAGVKWVQHVCANPKEYPPLDTYTPAVPPGDSYQQYDTYTGEEDSYSYDGSSSSSQYGSSQQPSPPSPPPPSSPPVSREQNPELYPPRYNRDYSYQLPTADAQQQQQQQGLPSLSDTTLDAFRGTPSSGSSSSSEFALPFVPLAPEDLEASTTDSSSSSSQQFVLSTDSAVEADNDGFFSDLATTDGTEQDVRELAQQQQQQQQQQREHPDLAWDAPLPPIPSLSTLAPKPPRPQVRPAPLPLSHSHQQQQQSAQQQQQQLAQQQQQQPRVRTSPPKANPGHQWVAPPEEPVQTPSKPSPTQQVLHHQQQQQQHLQRNDVILTAPIQQQQQQQLLLTSSRGHPGVILPAPAALLSGDLESKLQQTLQQVRKQHEVLELQQQLLQQQLELAHKQKELEQLQHQQQQLLAQQAPTPKVTSHQHQQQPQPVLSQLQQPMLILEQQQHQQLLQQQRQQLAPQGDQQPQQQQKHKVVVEQSASGGVLLLPTAAPPAAPWKGHTQQQQQPQQQQQQQHAPANQEDKPLQSAVKGTAAPQQQQQQHRVQHKQIGTVRVAPPAQGHSQATQQKQPPAQHSSSRADAKQTHQSATPAAPVPLTSKGPQASDPTTKQQKHQHKQQEQQQQQQQQRKGQRKHHQQPEPQPEPQQQAQQQQAGMGSWLRANLGRVADSIRKVAPLSEAPPQASPA